MPRRNLEYWRPKLRRNVERDMKDVAALKAKGYRVLIVWECETPNQPALEKRLRKFLRQA